MHRLQAVNAAAVPSKNSRPSSALAINCIAEHRTDAMQQTIALIVNGKQFSVKTDPDRPLLDVLREDLHLTGAKFGCGERQCGACTVLLDGKPVYSCSTRVTAVGSRAVET